jgi:two-component system, OmpR family, response regulator
MIKRPSTDPPSKTKVLLVEDDEPTCAMYAAALRMEGFTVRTALDGLAALRVIETFEPDVVILDLKLPIASGFEVLHELRLMRCTKPVIAVSGHDTGLSLARRNPEFFAALRKPFDPNDLIGVTRRAASIAH